MRRKVVFLLLVLGVFVGIILIVRLVRSGAPKYGVLKISSNPAATVFLDNKNIGRTPYEDKVLIGEYTIKLIPETTVQTLIPWQGKIRVSENLLTYVNRDLSDSELSAAGEILWLEKISSNQSEISVTTVPDGGNVILDEQVRGVTPVAIPDISAGDHTLTITSPGFFSRTLKIKNTGGYKLNAAVQLGLAPGGIVQTPTPTETAATPTPSAGVTGSLTPTPSKAASGSATAIPPRPYVTIRDTPTGFLRVREEPQTSADEIGRVSPGERYALLASEAGWYKIKFDGSKEGWISGQYADKVE